AMDHPASNEVRRCVMASGLSFIHTISSAFVALSSGHLTSVKAGSIQAKRAQTRRLQEQRACQSISRPTPLAPSGFYRELEIRERLCQGVPVLTRMLRSYIIMFVLYTNIFVD